MTRVLLSSVGLSPQVVTETLHVLANGQGWRPDRLILLTTKRGAVLCRELLLAEPEGALFRFARDWNAPWAANLAREAQIDVVDTDAGDLDASRAARAFEDRAIRILRDLCSDPDVELHVSLAGGRKPAAAVLAVALSFFARPQDRLSHVLVPEGIVGIPSFYYPPPSSSPVATIEGEVLDLAQVEILLLEIPFPRLRALLNVSNGCLEELVERVTAAIPASGLQPVRLMVDCAAATITWERRPIALPPALAAWLAWLATRQALMGGELARVGEARAAYAAFYGLFAGVGSEEKLIRRLPDPLDAEWMEEKASRVAKLAADCGIRPHGAKLVQRTGPRAKARYRLALDRHEVKVRAPPPGWERGEIT